MSFRCPSQTGLTEKDLVPYTGAGILSASDSTARDGQGMITPTAVASTLTTLRNTGVLPNIAGMTSENYSSKQRDFLTNVKKEYCYYESRYKYALDGLFSAIRDNYGQATVKQDKIDRYLRYTKQFNTYLNDITQLLNAISTDILTSNTSMDTEIKAYNQSIQDQKEKLDEQNKIITSSDAATKLNKQMIRYTEEKARRSNHLLSLYGFLNIVVVGLLIYVYKAAGDQE
jgi:hypothetical protein